jgi:hypothetical protein
MQPRADATARLVRAPVFGMTWLAALALAARGALGAAGDCNPYTPTTLMYFEGADPSAPGFQQLVNGYWTAKSGASGLGSPVDWQIVRNCSTRNELAVVTSSDDRALRLQVWNGSAWSAPSTLVANCGDIADRAFDAEYEQSSAELLAVYRKGGSPNLYYRTYAAGSPGEQMYSPGLGSAPLWVRLVAKPGSDEILMVVCAGSGLYGAVWNGSSFGNFTTLTNNLPPTGRPYGAAYMLTSGRALVVWGVNGLSTPQYALWSGGWSGVASLPAVGGTPGRIELAPCPKKTSNDVLLACIDSANHISVCNWNGSAWGAMTTVDTAAANDYERRVGLSYQPDGARALVLWHTNGQNAVRYKTWSGSAWSGTLVGPDLGSEMVSVRMVPASDSDDEIVAVMQHRGPWSIGDYQVYSSNGIDSLSGVTVQGVVGQQVGGVALPTPPSDAPGGADKSYGNGATATIAPGAYRDLTAGNGFVLNISAGQYVFRNWSAGNATTINADVTAGDIEFIVTGSVSAINNFTLNTTGTGRVTFRIVSGDFVTNNNASVLNASIIAYNGSINFGNNTTVAGVLWARNNITVNSGTIQMGVSPGTPSGTGKLSISRWSGGSLSPAGLVTSSLYGYNNRDCFGVSAPPFGAPLMYISRWREVGQDE